MDNDHIIKRQQDRITRHRQDRDERDRAIAAKYLAEGIEYGGALSTRALAAQIGIGATTVRTAITRWAPHLLAERERARVLAND